MPHLLFSLYGVLLTPPQPEDRLRVEQAVNAPDSEVFWSEYYRARPAYDSGLISDQRWWYELAQRVGLEETDFAEAVAADFGMRLDANQDMVDYVEGLIDQGYVVGVLANLPVGLARLVRAKHQWLEDLAAVTMSCDIGLAKPHVDSYAVAVDALSGTPKDTVYFDANPAWVAGAREAGLKAHLCSQVDEVRGIIEAL